MASYLHRLIAIGDNHDCAVVRVPLPQEFRKEYPWSFSHLVRYDESTPALTA